MIQPLAVLEKSKFVALILAVAFVAGPARGLGTTTPVVQIVSGADQQAADTSAFPKPLAVSVSDGVSGRAIPGIRVNFAPSSGIGLTSRTAITDEHGQASVKASGLAIGPASVRAFVDGYPSAKVDFAGLTVLKPVITIVPADLQSDVGVIPAIAEYTLRGFVDGDNAGTAEIAGSPLLTTTATVNSPDANYAIKGGVGSLTSPRYDFQAGFGTLVLRGTNGAARVESSGSAAAIASSIDNLKAVHRALLTLLAEVPHRLPAMRAGSEDSVQAALQPVVSRQADASPEVDHLRANLAAALPQTSFMQAGNHLEARVESVQGLLRSASCSGADDARDAAVPARSLTAALPRNEAAQAVSDRRVSGQNVRAALRPSSTANADSQAAHGLSVVRIGLTAPGTR